jgi:hypothetical protein
MSFMLDTTELERGLMALLARIDAGSDAGLDEAADLIQTTDEQTDAYYGQSGATRASTMASRLGPDFASKAASAYSVAARLLTGFTGHAGKAHREESGLVLGAHEKGVMLTNYTDYADALEADNAGEKAHIGPTIRQTAQTSTQLVAGFIKTEVEA